MCTRAGSCNTFEEVHTHTLTPTQAHTFKHVQSSNILALHSALSPNFWKLSVNRHLPDGGVLWENFLLRTKKLLKFLIVK